MPGELAQAGGAVVLPVTLQDRHDEIVQGGHRLRSDTASNVTGVLAQRDVAHVVQPVLNGPMPAAQAEQVGWPSPLGRQAGDLVVHLGVPTPLPLALVHEPTDPCQTGPHHLYASRPRSGMQRPNIDSPMPAINRPRAWCGLDRLERSAAAPATAPAGCPSLRAGSARLAGRCTRTGTAARTWHRP